MPCSGSLPRDQRRWQRCLDAVRADMLAAGWIERSLKFNEVRLCKAHKLYNRRTQS